ncbi:VWA domain-containing protein [Bacillus rubiinfantis]|uniref:VWA domain-containing protein n=1 Tax=Bacillus rubiinfantis TaxID=1499680 RepID=UPI0005A7BEEA|nr:VWA domain-containing protein [Bacillus rubiinfantis]
MKKVTALVGIIVAIVLLGWTNRTSAQTDSTAKVDFNVKSSQSVVVKPQNQNALGNLDVHLTPSGMSTGANRDPIDVVFIFDKSGSMDESGKNPQKFTSAKSALTEAVSYFKKISGPNDRFALIPFGSDVETNKVVYFSPNDVNQGLDLINQTVSSLPAQGGTNYTQSFDKALNLLQGSKNNKYIIFMTDGQPTFSINEEQVTYTKKKCLGFICWGEEKVTETVPVHYELYGTGSSMTNRVYFDGSDGNRYYKSQNVSQTVNNIKLHASARAEKLAQNNIKLFSIGFGSDSEVDMAYLRELSSKTGVSARQANTDNISSIFQDISKDIATPAIDGEVSVDLSKFNGKVSLVEGTDARLDGNTAIYKFNFNFPFNQEVNQSKDISFPFSFSETGTYTFDNINLTYKNLNGQTITVKHEPVTIEVKADAPPSFKGSMLLSGVSNTVDNLIKISNSNQTSNQYNVKYSLSPYGLINNTVTGTLTNLRIIQPLPEGISLIPSAVVKLITYNGKQAAQIDISQTINYANGNFSPTQVTALLSLQADWAQSNTVMPMAILQYKDSRFAQTQETTIAPSNQVINMKVRLNEFPDRLYEGDSLGVITKINNTTKNIISQTEFPNDFALKNKPVKDMIFGDDNTSIVITYFDNESVRIYLSPDFQLIGKTSSKQYQSGDEANEDVNVKLSQLIPGKEVKYYYQLNDSSLWKEIKPDEMISLTTSGKNTIKLKAEGGFARDNINPVAKTITIVRKIESITVDPEVIQLEVGSTKGFTVNILPADASNNELEITIGDKSIADFSDANRIIGVAEGNTELIIKAKDGSNIVVIVPIHVTDPYIPLKEIKFKKAVFKIKKGEKASITDYLIFNPANATNKVISTVTSTMSDKVEVKRENGSWVIVGKDTGYSTVEAIAEKQKDGSQPNDSALFEVIDNDDSSNNKGASGEGRW